jgi:type II secretory pathway component PulF
MRIFEGVVSAEECKNAPQVSKIDLAILAQALAVVLELRVPILECLSTLAKITPNARIRSYLLLAYDNIRGGGTLSESTSAWRDLSDGTFIQTIQDGEARGSLATSLFIYAKENGFTQHQLADQIGWSEPLKEFTSCMAHSLAHCGSIKSALGNEWDRLSCRDDEHFRNALFQIYNLVPISTSLHYAMGLHQDIFDPFYLLAVYAAERIKRLGRAFRLLAKL